MRSIDATRRVDTIVLTICAALTIVCVDNGLFAPFAQVCLRITRDPNIVVVPILDLSVDVAKTRSNSYARLHHALWHMECSAANHRGEWPRARFVIRGHEP